MRSVDKGRSSTLELDGEGVFRGPAKQNKLKIAPRAGDASIVRVKVILMRNDVDRSLGVPLAGASEV